MEDELPGRIWVGLPVEDVPVEGVLQQGPRQHPGHEEARPEQSPGQVSVGSEEGEEGGEPEEEDNGHPAEGHHVPGRPGQTLEDVRVEESYRALVWLVYPCPVVRPQ